jgi:uridine kinase
MIEKAILDLNIERSKSWLIGDTSVDILTAKRVGIRSILVETGYAGLDHKHLVTPDYILPDLPSAVDFIIDFHPRLMSELTPIALEITQGSIVLVGGQSRSGKSFFASALVERLSQMGKNTKVVSTDFWLRSEDQRAAGVMGRHDMEALLDFVNSICNSQRPFSINIPAYKKKYREQIQNANVLHVDKEDIVIFEGVIALGLHSVIQTTTSKFFVQTDETIRRLRIINEYLLRGIDEKTANEIYQKRLIDEFELVSSLGQDAIKIQFENFNLMGFS